jgi:hypothetical protein
MESGKKCSVTECHKIVQAHGLCDMHRKRLERHGHTEPTRPVDWGSRQKHPLLKTWAWLMRTKRTEIVPAWHDFWQFVADVGNARPSVRHRPSRQNQDLPFGPGNFYWREPDQCTTSPDARAQSAAHSRKWYRANRDKAMDAEMRRHFGISMADYHAMMVEQGSVCAICGNPESRVDHRTKLPRRLAVDHCHKSGKVRGLLCAPCNQGIGHLKDDPALLRKAIIYLER